MKTQVFASMLLCNVVIGLARADDYSSALKTTLLTYPETVDVAGMGGAQIGVFSSSSENPAAYPAMKKYGIGAAGYGSYNFIDFRKGPDVRAGFNSYLAALGPGVLRFDYVKFASNRVLDKAGVHAELDGEMAMLGYGFPLAKNFFIGATITPLSQDKSSGSLMGLPIGEGKGKSTFGGRVGLLYIPIEQFSLGVMYECGKDRIRSWSFDPFASNPLKVYEYTVEHDVTSVIRPGIALKPWQGGTFACDWMYGAIDDGTRNKDYRINKWFVGFEQWLSPAGAVRVGVLDGGLTTGFTLHKQIHKKDFLLDCAYVDRVGKDLNPYFGKASALMLSLTLAW